MASYTSLLNLRPLLLCAKQLNALPTSDPSASPAKVINRDVPIAEENTTLTGQPATNMYDDWSEEMEDRADNVYDDTKKKSAGNKKSKEKKLKEIDEVVKEDLE